MSHIINNSDPIRAKLWRILDQIRAMGTRRSAALLRRERAIRRAWLADQVKKAGGR